MLRAHASRDDRFRDAERAIAQRVVEKAEHWFPGSGSRPTVRLRRFDVRPRAALYAVYLDGETRAPKVLAKVRVPLPGPAADAGTRVRPRLATGWPSVAELTRLEYSGLRDIHAMCSREDSPFAAIRPLDHLPAENTILMDYVRAPTLRQILMRENRLSPRRVLHRSRGTNHVWEQVGAWLEEFHREMSHPPASRQTTRDEVVEMFGAFHEFLTSRLGRKAVGETARSGAELAAEVLPERFTLVRGHGDFAPRNVFLCESGRLAVFDPMPRWSIPRHEDLGRFLVGVRLLGLQVHSRGAAYSEQAMNHRERAVIEGYRRKAELGTAELRCYQLLITLETWAGMVAPLSPGLSRRVASASVRLSAGYLRREAQRLLEAARDERIG